MKFGSPVRPGRTGDQSLSLIHISHDLDQVFQNTKGNLSGGERQKLALARVLTENKGIHEQSTAVVIDRT